MFSLLRQLQSPLPLNIERVIGSKGCMAAIALELELELEGPLKMPTTCKAGKSFVQLGKLLNKNRGKKDRGEPRRRWVENIECDVKDMSLKGAWTEPATNRIEDPAEE